MEAMSSNEIFYALIFVGVAVVISTLVTLIIFVLDKFKHKKIKEDCQEGFGIVYNKELLLDNERPLIFETLKEAKDHAEKRGFDKPPALNPMKIVDLKYVYQRWFVGEQKLVLHALNIREEK